MQIFYDIKTEDFVDFNFSYMNADNMVRRNIRNTRCIAAGLVLVGGYLLMRFLNMNLFPAVLVYAALAILVFAYAPVYVRFKVKQSIRRMLARPQNKGVCAEKTLTLEESCFHLCGGEDSRYEYQTVEKITEDAGHYFIYVGPMSAVIVPFRAFASGEEKAAFYNELCRRVESAGGRIKAA